LEIRGQVLGAEHASTLRSRATIEMLAALTSSMSAAGFDPTEATLHRYAHSISDTCT
jgi:hypothetical protein